MPNPVNQFYDFDGFRVDTQKRRLLRGGDNVPLTPKAFDTLLALVERRGQVVEKDDLMKVVWPDTIVEEGALSRNIYLLRRALGEGPDDRRFIVTAPGRGYRFVANVADGTPESMTDLIVATRERTRVVAEQEDEERDEPDSSARPTRPTAVAAVAVVVALVSVGLGSRWWSARSAGMTPAVRTLAVLPFQPLVADDRDHYLGLGMADALITRLGTLQHLIVRPTSAILEYTGANRDPQTAGAALKVDAVLDGSIQRSGDRIRVSARLLSAPDGRSIWTSELEVKFTELFAVEDQLSQKLAEALAPTLTGEEKRQLAKRGTTNSEAKQAYWRGRYFWSRWNRVSLEKAVAAFEEALRADPSYAPALSGLADSYNLLGYLGFMPPSDAYPKSRETARQALALDPSLGEAHVSLAKTELFYEWNWHEAENEIKRALVLNPNYADAHGLYGAYLLAVGDFDRALVERKQALELDPASPLMMTMVGWVYFYNHRYDEAIEWYRKALDIDPNFAQGRVDLFNAFYHQGSYDRAFEEIIRLRTRAGATPEALAALKQAYASQGIAAYWRSEKESIEKQGDRVSPWRAARIYAALGDRDRAFAWLDRAYRERTSALTFIKTVPLFDSLHSDARFAALLRRMGLQSS